MNQQNGKIRECDILVVGGGGSGALAAVEASRHPELKIILASKGPVGQSGITPTANGGTSAVGTADELFKDMVTGGDFLSDQSIVWFMVNEIQRSLEKLKQFGISIVPLRGKTVCVPCAETLNRLRTILVRTGNIELLEDVLVTGLLTSEGDISGVTALDLAAGEFFVVKAKAVVVATGGCTGELYPYTSNNPFGISTDSSATGHIMAYTAGAELIDMEMIQFVPLPAHPRCVNLRYFPDFWEGPYENRFGEIVESNIYSYPGNSYSYTFIQKLFREMEEGRGPIYIDQRNVKKPHPQLMLKAWERRRKQIRSLGIDPREHKLEIVIGSHFGMGGLRVNEKTETAVSGLYAAGEVMGGVHGGMRVPGYSLTQMIVYGFEAGKQAAEYVLQGKKRKELPANDIAREREKVFRFLEPKGNPISLVELKRQLQQVMGRHVFIFREKPGLLDAINKIREIKTEISRVSVPNFKRFNIEWARAIEFSLMVEAAEIIARSALAREESRGFQYRRDFPEQDNNTWLRHIRATSGDGEIEVDSVPVVLNRMKPEG